MRYQEKVSTGKVFFTIAFKGASYELWSDKGLGHFDIVGGVDWSTDKWEEFLNFANTNYGTGF
tara:strand:+ start:1863 stop:2051 length:189 start_codon:yes stop_codon:yes gene_type:complete